MVAVIIGGSETEDGQAGSLLVEGVGERLVLQERGEGEIGALW